MSFKGLGVVDHPDGKVYFVRGVWPGDTGVFQVTSSEKRYGFANLVELKESSPQRVTPDCKHLGFQVGQCGGCPWMVGTYDSQLQIKNELVQTLLKRNDLIAAGIKVHPIQGSENSLSYRNRAQFKTDGTKLGYVSPESHELVDIEDCVILTPEMQSRLSTAREQLPSDEWSDFPGKHRWNLLDLDDENETIEINKRMPFKQGNSEQNTFMKNWLTARLKTLPKNNEVIELFSGAGNFTEILSAQEFSKITAFEMSKAAIEELNQKALPGVKGFVQNIYDHGAWKQMMSVVTQPKILVMDPPREGFKDVALFLKKLKSIETIIYVSCDPSTWAQDVKSLRTLGYLVDEVQPLDQFPNTPHIEILSILTKK